MNILILSGGTGSANLSKGLKEFSQDINVVNYVNLYDSGKSTGVVRRVFDSLGPSDLRKIQYQQYLNKFEEIDEGIKAIFEGRFDITNKEVCYNVLKHCNFGHKYKILFEEAIDSFYNLVSNNESLKDFSIANILYSYLFKKIGYRETTLLFKNFLGIEDDVIINSENNYWLKAVTENNYIIEDEGDIVSYNNESDRISKVYLEDNTGLEIFPIFDKSHEKFFLSADIIIISAGTLFSSLIPTLLTRGLKEVISRSSAKKYLVMNNEQDLDTIGFSSLDILEEYNNYIRLKEFKIIMNEDANNELKKISQDYSFYFGKMGNSKGKHNSKKLAEIILKDHFGLTDKHIIRNILLDFDDTLYTRDTNDSKKVTISKENIKILNSIFKYKTFVISGNSYDRIHHKLSSDFGIFLENISFRLFCDGGLVEYSRGEKIFYMQEYLIPYNMESEIEKFILSLENSLRFEKRGEVKQGIFCLSITSLEKKYRHLLCIIINDWLEKNYQDFSARKTGKGTIDIFHKEHNKLKLESVIDLKSSLYIGDEVFSGNDKEIANACSISIQVKDVFETNTILKLLGE